MFIAGGNRVLYRWDGASRTGCLRSTGPALESVDYRERPPLRLGLPGRAIWGNWDDEGKAAALRSNHNAVRRPAKIDSNQCDPGPRIEDYAFLQNSIKQIQDAQIFWIS